MSFNFFSTNLHTYLLTYNQFSWTFCRDNGIALLVETFVSLFAELYLRHTCRSMHLCRFSICRTHNHLNYVLIYISGKYQLIIQSINYCVVKWLNFIQFFYLSNTSVQILFPQLLLCCPQKLFQNVCSSSSKMPRKQTHGTDLLPGSSFCRIPSIFWVVQ